jgi:hypothetical protein
MISQYLNSFFSDTPTPRQYITRVIINTFGKDQFQLFVTMSAKYMLSLLLLKVLLLLLLRLVLLLLLMMLVLLLLMLMLVKLMLQLKMLLLLLLMMVMMLLLVLLHGPDALSDLDARGGHGRQREGHGGEDGCAQLLLLLLLHAAGLGDEYGLHAAHHGHGGEAAEAAHLTHGELGVGVVALGGGGSNRLDGLGLVHAGRFRRRRG